MNQLRKLFRSARWRARAWLRRPYRDERELADRLSRLPEPTAPGRTFRFHWGGVEYPSASDLRGQYSEIFVRRHYAFQARRADPVIIDGGGNIGMSAIWFKQAYPEARVTVYEADPALAALLARNLAAAGMTDVTVRNAAVWIHDGVVAFDNLGQDKGAVRTTGSIQVPCVDLAAALPEHVDLLKLDVEGAEFPILERLCATGSLARVQNLVAEFHVRRSDFDRALATLQRLREAGMQVTFTAALGPYLGPADGPSAFEVVGRDQVLMDVYAWR